MKRIFPFLLLACVCSPLIVQAQLTNTPDEIETENGILTVDPINHGTVVLTWNDIVIYSDPYGGGDAFSGIENPDIILITDIHGDHLNMETIEALETSEAIFVVPQAVADQMPDSYSDRLIIIGNGEATEQMGIDIAAIPMYNMPAEDARHVKGRGNGYILNLEGTRVYLSGDTEDIPEMRNLENIDVAFICMNLPYTMDIKQAASAVLEFKPGIVYPYHHRGQDIQEFKALVNAGDPNIEVRLKDWYPDN